MISVLSIKPSLVKKSSKVPKIFICGYPFSVILFRWFLILFLLKLTHIFLCFMNRSSFCSEGFLNFIFLSSSSVNSFSKFFIHKWCIVSSNCFLFHWSMFIKYFQKIICDSIVTFVWIFRAQFKF